MAILMLVVGLIVLTGGAELLVRGASKLAVSFGVSPLVVGLTVVSFGTSAPELVVCLQSALSGQPDVALGNIVGSNIFNILLILGLSAIIVPLHVSQQLVRVEVPLMIGLSALVWLMAFNGSISRLDGLILSTGLVAYTLWAIIKSRREQGAIQAEYEAEFGQVERSSTLKSGLINGVMLLAGLILLVVGARWFVEAAVTISRSLGVSELIIGLTIVAAGTSLPEAATSVMAAIRGERDIAVGNAIGSNLFNIMAVLGISSLVSPIGVPVPEAALHLDLPVMVAVAVACLPIFFTGHLISRWEGILFFSYYLIYTASMVISAAVPELERTFEYVIFGIVVPLTLITIAVGVIRSIKAKQPEGEASN
ncbi:Inner membrane protein YrbG [Thalassoglobus neptunius]|uniref:Inner membrane protein YrbG n=1 Tax=Thalassoglobus neptunius TaxID=1938619 RepID=A0A5C5WXG3_9PLAN|nr:calcium/sodium antiporter [Thalassoglobus neptunius]TWT55416.1 Inner membrane protein YrbG [Thalassoglobus neptunius]